MYQLSKNYPEKRAFITGAASGLGKAFSFELAKEGWTIGMADINMDQLAEVAAEVNSLGGTALRFHLDVSDKIEYKTVAESFLEKYLLI